MSISLVLVGRQMLYSCSTSRYGKIEGVKILPQRYPNLGVAAFIDFYDVRSAIDAKEAKIVFQGCELRTNFKAKPTEKFEHPTRKEAPASAKRQESPEKETKDKDKEKARGNERYNGRDGRVFALGTRCALIGVGCSVLLLE